MMREWINLFESKLDDNLLSIVSAAHEQGMELEIESSETTLSLISIRRNNAERGAGAKVMTLLCQYADRHKLLFSLDAEAGSPGLIKYYEAFGFSIDEYTKEQMDEYGEEFDGPWEMFRDPRAELNETPLQPSEKFVCFHGNYCGPGNRGGKPIDELDRACFKHDCEYDKSYKDEGDTRRRRQNIADIHFVKRCLKVAQDRNTKLSIRIKAKIAAKYFMGRISRCPLVPHLPNLA